MPYPSTSGSASPPVPPRLVVSGPPDDELKTNTPPTLASRRRSKTESSALRATTGRQPSLEWLDVDEPSPRRRKRTSTKRTTGSSNSRQRSRSSTESEVASRFSPKLSRISESSESRSTSRPSTSGSSESRKQRERTSPSKPRYRDESAIVYRRPVKHRVGGVAKRSESGFKLNPSLLSVLSTLTGTSDRSSSSNTTITQDSYDRRSASEGSKIDPDRRRMSESEGYARYPHASSGTNVFDFMDPPSVDDGHDGRSIYSTSSSLSSQYEHSDAGSSELPDTPSSHSTFPSPASTRNSSLSGSVAELRRKYDPQFATSNGSTVATGRESYSPEMTTRTHRKLTNPPSVPEEDEGQDENGNDATSHSNGSSGDERRRTSLKSSRPSRPMQRPEDRLRYQEEAVRHHLAQSQQSQPLVDPVYGQHRSRSASSHGSSGSARSYAQQMAMQHYQYSSPPAPPAYPAPPQAMNGHAIHPDRPPAPDPPDFTQRTIAGYEQLALELSNASSDVKPMYRKFEYLNHRILLHMQDELSEMEDQLRCIDEAIAQMEPQPADGPRPPASRRGDAFNGSEMHHHRTALLGRIFLKTEQYNRAMSSFASLNKDSSPAESEQVSTYQSWLKKTSPIHEIETRFLQFKTDLVLPGQRRQEKEAERSGREAALTTFLPVALMLPLLLFSLIPTLAGRLVVTALIAVGAWMVAATTRVRFLMEGREWAVCGGAYVLLMTAIAGCVPVHGAG